MGKLKDLASVSVSDSKSFVYMPPPQAYKAMRVLIKPNLAYKAPHPAVVSKDVLGAVLRGVRRATPGGRILIVEGITGQSDVHELYEYHGITDLIDGETRLGDVEELPMIEFENLLKPPKKYDSMWAPGYMREFDCVISINSFKRTMLNDKPLISASLKNLYGFFPRDKYAGRSPHSRGQLHKPDVPTVLHDVYFSIGRYVHGAVVDISQKYISPDWKPDRIRRVGHDVGKVVWGDDMLAVDEVACRTAGEDVPDYINSIRKLRNEIKKQS